MIVTRKRFGQHFLRDQRVLASIAEALGKLEGRTVVEIGPGRGALTDLLAVNSQRLIAIEVDRDLVSFLRDRYADRPNVEILEADVLTVDLGAKAGGSYVLAGNVPYYITTPILFHTLARPRPELSVFLVQHEVAVRMAAAPGSKEYGALSVNLQAVADVELIRHVAPGAFQPPPKVDSAVVRVTPRAEGVVEPALERRFQRFVLAAFGLRRKQLQRVVRTVCGLDAISSHALIASCDLDPEARPETLSANDFAALVKAMAGAQAAP